MDGVRILQLIIILVPVLVALYLLRLAKTLNLEKRLANFALTSTKDEEVSFFDKLIYYFWIVVHKLSKLLKNLFVIFSGLSYTLLFYLFNHSYLLYILFRFQFLFQGFLTFFELLPF